MSTVFNHPRGELSIQGVALLMTRAAVEEELGHPLGVATSQGSQAKIEIGLEQDEESITMGSNGVNFYAKSPSLGVRYGCPWGDDPELEESVTFIEGTQLEQSGAVLIKTGTAKTETLSCLGKPRRLFSNDPRYLIIPSLPPSFAPDDWDAAYYSLYFEMEEPVLYQTWPEGEESWYAPSENLTLAVFFANEVFFGATLSLRS